MGKVLPNYTVQILDKNGLPVPIGFPGEICIGGAGIGLGYINRPEETANKFVKSKIMTPQDASKKGLGRLYHSGDKGRILENGYLEFLGRMDGDSQVKIRGIRIELDEIANVIIKASDEVLIDAGVSVRGGSDTLVAFVVFAAGFTGNRDAFLDGLKVALPLPIYMCPSIFVPVNNLPRNVNGKKDRTAIDTIPLPETRASGNNTTLNSLQLRVKDVWAEALQGTLKSSEITMDSDFFHIGGNSLLLLKLQTALHTTFGHRISLPELFQSSTFRSMVARIQTATASGAAVLDMDWNREVSSLLDGFAEPSVRASWGPPPRGNGLSIVLTGATGFLGRNILERLVEDKTGEGGTLYCHQAG